MSETYESRLAKFLLPWCLKCRDEAGIPTSDDIVRYDGQKCEKCEVGNIPILDEHDFTKSMQEKMK